MTHKQGTFYILSIRQEATIRQKEGMKIFGVRHANFLPDQWVRKTECTPPYELLMFCKKLEKENLYLPHAFPKVAISFEANQYLTTHAVWDEFVFKKVYLPNFLTSINHNKAKEELHEMANYLAEGTDVYYACFCPNEKMCHRRIIAGLMQKKGYAISNQL